MAAKTEEPGACGVFRAELCVRGAAGADDSRNVNERFHVVDGSRLAEEPRLRRKWRFVAWFAAIAFNRVEERGLFAADIRASAAANFNVELQPAAQNVVAKEPVFVGGVDRVLHALRRQRIFAAQVDVALASAGNKTADRDALDHGKRISFHQDAVLERARLGFIGIADEVVRAARILLKQMPLLK